MGLFRDSNWASHSHYLIAINICHFTNVGGDVLMFHGHSIKVCNNFCDFKIEWESSQ
jgi:hypothetical protein